MIGEWGLTDWAIVILDVIAIVIVILFLRKKIQSKLKEVEENRKKKVGKLKEIES